MRDEEERSENRFDERSAGRHPHRASQGESETHFDRRDKHFDKSGRKPDFSKKFRKDRTLDDYDASKDDRKNRDYKKTGNYNRSANDRPNHWHAHGPDRDFEGGNKQFSHKSRLATGRPPRKYNTERKFSEKQDFDRPERKFDRPQKKYRGSAEGREGGFDFPRRHYGKKNPDGQDQKRSSRFSGNRSEKPFSSRDDRGGKKAFTGKSEKASKFLDRKGAAKGNGRSGGQHSGRPNGGSSAGRRR